MVLVATGSFCPVHKMHVRMFDIARAHLVSNGLVRPGPMCVVPHSSPITFYKQQNRTWSAATCRPVTTCTFRPSWASATSPVWTGTNSIPSNEDAFLMFAFGRVARVQS